jgi:hypothetical protein
MKKILYIVVLIQGFLFLSFAQTNIPPGDVYGTWGITGSPYNILGDITIPDDSTLTIEPGVFVEFQDHYTLNVQGRLLAIGSEANNISFTIDDTTGFYNSNSTLGGWNGIQFIDTPSDNDTSKIIYCTLQYGKAVGSSPPDNSGGAIFISNFNKVLIASSLITNNSAGGSNSPSGGGLSLYFANITIVENVISHNRALDGGGIKIWEADPVLIGNLIDSNQADEGGGGIWIGGLSNIEFNYDIITNNIAGGNGGGIICWQNTVTTLNSVNVFDNSANWGGGIGFIDADTELNDCNVNDNGAVGLGGGIGSDFSNVYINNTAFSRDTSGFLGGSIHSWFSDLLIEHSIFEENSSDLGGALYSEMSEVRIDTSSFINNDAQFGGALYLYDCNLGIDSCYFDGNEALSEGGALDYKADTLIFGAPYEVIIYNSRFLNNTALNAAGGFSIKQTHTESPLINLEIDKCEISNNFAHHVGGFRILRCLNESVLSNSIINGNVTEAWVAGGTFNDNSPGEVFNCLFYNNHAATVNVNSTTGGLGISAGSKVNVFNCTFANNTSGAGGGVQVYRGGDATVTNSIFWNNSPDQFALNAVLDSLPCLLIVNYNDIQYGIDSIKINDTVSTFIWGDGNIDEDPLFVNTLNNDFHLQNSSPCIGAGIDSIEIAGIWQYAPLTDIEGNPRPNPVGTMPDMGAYESQFPSRVEEQNSEFPTEFSLSQNYPNPFNPITKISWQSPVSSWQTLKVYDILGTQIATLVNEEIPAGEYEIEFNGDDLTSGIYFYQLKAGSYIETKKMVLMK